MTSGESWPRFSSRSRKQRERGRQDEDVDGLRDQPAHLLRALPVDFQQHVVAARDLIGEPRRGRRIPVAVDVGVLEELAVGLEREEARLVDEVIVDAVGLAGTRRARRVRNRKPDPGLALEQRRDEARLAAARRRGQHEQAPGCRRRLGRGARCGVRRLGLACRRRFMSRPRRLLAPFASRGPAPRYSRFCTCSRICSISTFISSDACESSASTDFEPSVFASRCSSCIRKSRRLPALPPAVEHAAHLGDVGAKPRELLGDVDLGREERELLLQPVAVGVEPGLAQARAELLGIGRLDAPESAARRARPAASMASQRSTSMAASFAPSRARDAESSASASPTSRRACARELFRRHGRLGEDARPAQDLADRQRPRVPERPWSLRPPPSRARPTRARSTARPDGIGRRPRRAKRGIRPCRASIRARICSRSVASSPRNSSGSRTWRSRKRWLTERSSTASATPGSSAATAAKPVMLRIIAETRRIQATFPTLLWALSSGECMRYPLQAQARDRTIGMRIASEFRG